MSLQVTLSYQIVKMNFSKSLMSHVKVIFITVSIKLQLHVYLGSISVYLVKVHFANFNIKVFITPLNI